VNVSAKFPPRREIVERKSWLSVDRVSQQKIENNENPGSSEILLRSNWWKTLRPEYMEMRSTGDFGAEIACSLEIEREMLKISLSLKSGR
jgi:hypothetical protein